MDWRETEAAAEDPLLARTSLPAMVEASVGRHAERDAQRYKGGVYDRSLVASSVVDAAPDGGFASLTYAEFGRLVRRLAAGFRELGVDPTDRVALFAPTRMEWAQLDVALLAAGGVVTTVYPSATDRLLRDVLDDAGVSGVVVDGRERLERVAAVAADLETSLEFVVVMDDVGGGDAGDAPDVDATVLTVGELHGRGEAVFDPDAYDRWVDGYAPDELATLIYTSGTTGRPKGVRLTHWNLQSNVNACYRRFGPHRDADGAIGPGAVMLSFLPLAHVFERLAGHLLMLGAGATVAYAESPDSLREDFRLVRPTVGTSVPRVYEKLYDTIRAEASSSPLRLRVFEWAADVGRRRVEASNPGPLLRLQTALADRLVYRTVQTALGGRVDFLISGGGSLSPELCRLYHGMGVPILEGYGLTETSPVVSVNPPEAPRIGTIGPPLYGVETRLDTSVGGVADDGDSDVGELLVRGPNVTDGYWNRPAATERAFVASEDGGDPWFRTGDVVRRDADGYLVFRERAKQLLKLSTGKYVAPGPLEDAFAASPFVDQCLVVGDGRKFVGALVVPREAAVREWADREGVDLPDEWAACCRDSRVRERIQRLVDAVNDGFEPHERIKRIRLVPEEFTEEAGLLTPTMKKRRAAILDRYETAVADLYADA